MSNEFDIPNAGGGVKKPGGFCEKLRAISPGEYFLFPKDKRASVFTWAAGLGIKVKTRSMGSKDTIRIYHAGFVDE